MTTFNDLKLDPKVLQAVTEAGYEKPTPIQAEAIPHALAGKDVLGIAQTGTGKTASFVLPMITLLAKGRARARMPRSLVLCPTRELAAQVAENFENYAKHMKLSMALLIGGVSFNDQDKKIDRGVDVLIATPGRLLDHFERGKLMLNGVQIMVVDEADRMLDMGFIPDIERIFKLTPFTRQTLFFSATMAPEITRVTNEFLSNPVRVEVARQATTSETITQSVIMHRPTRKDAAFKDKREILRLLVTEEGEKLTNAIVFCNRKRDVDVVAKSMKSHGFDAAAIHGDLDQSVRTRILDEFREGKLRLLIASDVAARGLDIPAVSHVYNFDVPIHAEDYVHRIGRTGRAGREGKAITICVPSDEKYLAAIEDLVKKQVPRQDSPMKGQTAPAAKAEPKAKPQPQPQPRQSNAKTNADETATASQPRQQTNQNRPQENRDQKSAQPNQRNNPQPRSNSRNDNNRIVGMGDHVPAFMMIDISAALTSAGRIDEEPTPVEVQVTDAAVETVETVEAPKKPARKPSTRKKAEPTADGVEEKPKKPRVRRKKSDEVVEATVTDETAPVAADAEPEAVVKPKRKYTRRIKKTDEATEAAPVVADVTPTSDG